MKVLVIPSWYSTERNEIAGVFVREQCKALIQSGINVDVLFADLDFFNILNPSSWFKSSFSLESGVPVFRMKGFSFPKRNLFLSQLWCNLYVKCFGLYQEKHAKPDLIHAHSYFAGMVAMAIKQKYGIAYVLTEHHSGFVNHSLPVWHHQIIKEVLDNANCIIALNNKLKDNLLENTQQEIKVIPNLIDTSVFKYKEKSANTVFKLLSIGFLIKRKGYELLIEALSQIKNDKLVEFDIELTIIGEGTERKHLENLINKFDLSQTVKLIGIVEHEKLIDFLYKADLFVSASFAETQGVAISQALCVGLPVISTAVGGLQDIIVADNGLLVPPGDVKSLANAIVRIITNYKDYNKKAISEKARNEFDPSVITEKLIAIYSNISSKG